MKLIWPFAARVDGAHPGASGSGMWRRIDQGQDMQAPVGMAILAVADGTIEYRHNAVGFGDPYPVLHLDEPVDGNPAVYYGHTHPEVPDGARVKQGDVIAHAAQIPGGNAKDLPGWLELGWWRTQPTGDGQSMHDHIGAAEPFHGGVLPIPPTPPPGPRPDPTSEEDDMPKAFKVHDPTSGGDWWFRQLDGSLYCDAGAPYCGALNEHKDWGGAGGPDDPLVGADNWKDENGQDGYVLVTEAPGGLFFYHFDRAGTFAKPTP